MKDLMIHLDNSAASDSRLQVALQLAARFEARLTGVFAVIDRKIGAKTTQPSDEVASLIEQAEASFKQRTAEAGVEQRWVSRITGSGNMMVKAVLAWASSSDMAVLGQHDPDASVATPRDLVEQVINNCGRPVLVIPFAMSQRTIGNKIMIAFNGGREASRAMNDAIPLLKLSNDVRLAIVNWSSKEEGEYAFTENDVVDHLGVHGIDVKIERFNVDGIGIMDLLLARLAEESMDMLVMGAHGHYGFPHLFKGSSTRHILDHMTVPVLMSH
ncbi:MAG: universal stress protein [Alphaproteobacteria bacterium]|jgi:nucleotide-binding universal stress UspA family protein|nr:universal stress protein [Alphaproteobacteria bacterium]